MSGILRAGVIGAGVFGGYHAGKYASLPGVKFIGAFDHHPAHAEALAAKHGGQVFKSERDLIEAVDIVSIATPAIAHAPSALAALRAGKPVYVEKPIAADLADAHLIVAEAASRGLPAACGFLERAGFAAMGLLEIPERPLLLEAVRLGPPSPRNLDVSVVLDLMIHDLDLANALGAYALGAGARRALMAVGTGRPGGPLDEVEVRGERPGPLASALDGARALDLAIAVEQAAVL